MPSATPFLHLKLAGFIAISSGPLLEHTPALSPAEQASIAPMAPLRLAEFAQGRWHARKALAQLGLADANLPMAADRSPVWPPGFVGSISHVPPDLTLGLSGHVVAVAAHTKDCGGLGVDVERSARLMPEHWPAFMSEQELAWLRERPVPQRDALAHGVWSAKEATMKALRLPLDPLAIEVYVHNDGRTFTAQCLRPGMPASSEPVAVEGGLSFEPGWVMAVATLNSSLRT
jgi:4'-phosphopantetheinyl transferase EntD